VSAARAGAAIAIDHGTKRTGFAVADALRIATEPLAAFHGAGDAPALLDHVAALASEREVAAFVVGLPLNMDGTESARCADVRRFMAALAARFPAIRVVGFDERLTTKAAEELARELGLRGRDARARRDSLSALVLLRDWIASGEPGRSP
jgi:putative Holliday junction resolvase